MDPLFSTSNRRMSIQTLSPGFDVIHQWLSFIKLYKNSMMFWGNARIFSTSFFGRREYCICSTYKNVGQGPVTIPQFRISTRPWNALEKCTSRQSPDSNPVNHLYVLVIRNMLANKTRSVHKYVSTFLIFRTIVLWGYVKIRYKTNLMTKWGCRIQSDPWEQEVPEF